MPSTGARSLEAKDPLEALAAGHDRNVVVAQLRRGTYKCCFLDENEKTVRTEVLWRPR
jgi:hypothetical protein